MTLRFAAARAVAAVSTWGLKHVFRRPAANFPGKVALYVDPQLIAHLRGKLGSGSIMVVGTNGKTTVTNLLADVVERSGASVVCNRTGANLDSGVSTALLHARRSTWGVFESDELWLAKILPQLRADYVLLLNLFRDQLDRCGEIDRIQDSIVRALGSSPESVLVYNADDPLCASIADRAAALPGRERTRSIAFGVAESMGLAQNTVADATMCQRCSTMFEYAWRQYGQLGEYHCPNCGFSRPALDFAARDVRLDADGLAFTLASAGAEGGADASGAAAPGDAAVGGTAGERVSAAAADAGAAAHPAAPVGAFPRYRAAFSGAYMVYNLLAVGVAAQLLGCPSAAVQQGIDAFDPRNGRLQAYELGGRRVLLNLAKNPTGFNQNLKIVAQDMDPKAVAFFINDKEADGHDVSWLWDVDFEELAEVAGPLTAFAGGIRARDMQVRLKYAGIDAACVEDANDLISRLAQLPREVNAYLIANYTALPSVKAALDAAASGGAGAAAEPAARTAGAPAEEAASGIKAASASASAPAGAPVPAATPTSEPIRIAHLFPDLLNLYGDGGNVRVLEQRLRWRGIPVEVRRVRHGDAIDLGQVDLVMMGGSPDREQKLASADVVAMRDDLAAYVEAGGPLLAICGSYQMLGREWLVDGEVVDGLGLVDIRTGRPGTSGDRLVSNIVLQTPLATRPVVGYENHAGRTHLGPGVEAFGTLISSVGCGNDEETKQDGVRYKNVIGTYLHGPLLAKNPEIADWLLARALERHATRTGTGIGGSAHANGSTNGSANAPAPVQLAPLDDTAEEAANAFMCHTLGVRV